ncbi:MAG: phosphoribosylglycinamide formyltransferase-1 [bacterium]|jgi:phosphoribosylglycinamide formyltransferase-1
MLKTAVFISGRGSNLQSVIDGWKDKSLSIDLALVVSNIAGVQGLERAEKENISTTTIPHKDYSSREEFEKVLHEKLQEAGIEFIVLAGFMRLLSPWFIQHWKGKIINIHPSLLPAFPGLHTHRKAIEYGVKYSGCSVFFVDEGVDTGAIINQAIVSVSPEDTEDDLAQRILKEEHQILPEAIELVATKKVTLINGKVVYS